MFSIIILFSVTVFIFLILFLIDKSKTMKGLKKGALMFINVLPLFLTILILVSFLLFLLPDKILIKYLGKDSGIMGMIIAALLGSISLIPGFISYPLGKILLDNGVQYNIIAIFITTLMMVGIVTMPIEIKYFGIKVTLIRNLLSFIAAIIIGTLIGVVL